MTLALPFTQEQEDLVTKEIKAIQNAFNLGQGLKYTYPFGHTHFHQHYLKDRAIWELCTFLEGYSYDDEKVWRPLVLTGEIDSCIAWNEKFADSINELAFEMWESDIGVKSLIWAEEKLHEKYDTIYSSDSWVKFVIQSKQDKKIDFWIDAPKQLAVSLEYPLEHKKFADIYLVASEMMLETLKNCVDFYNHHKQLAYNFALSMWQNIHQFINDQKINERLGVQSPPFSLELYKLHKKPILDYRDLL